MFDDILGGNDKKEEMDEKDSLIEAMKYNIKEKDKIIVKLNKEITRLEEELMRATGGI